MNGRLGKMAFASTHLPEGSPWCDGNATYWWTGHDHVEMPRCSLGDGDWGQGEKARLPEFNEGSGKVDRHGCAAMDVDQDGLVDLLCTEGAERGKGNSYVEVYLTNETTKEL